MKRKGQQAEKDKIERVTGLGRRTREEIATWNQMTALRFKTGEETSERKKEKKNKEGKKEKKTKERKERRENE